MVVIRGIFQYLLYLANCWINDHNCRKIALNNFGFFCFLVYLETELKYSFYYNVHFQIISSVLYLMKTCCYVKCSCLLEMNSVIAFYKDEGIA